MHRRERMGDIQVAFDDHGAGPAVVLLHPFPFDGRAWTDNIQAVVDGGHRVVTLDYPGFGDSSVPRDPLSIEGLAKMVAHLIERLGISTVALIGLSMGGYVALAFARYFRERLWALVLADTRAAADGPAALQGRAAAVETIRAQGVDTYLSQSLPRLLAPDTSAHMLARVLALAERREDTLTAGIAALRDRADRTAELPAITCPTLVVVGAGDQVSPPEEMRAMAAAIPGARFVELAGCGHLSNLEAPGAFNQAVVDFLRGISDPQHPDATRRSP